MIRRLLTLNGLGIISVILFHATGWGFVAMFFWTDRYLPVSTPNFAMMGSPSYYILRLVEQAVVFTIPAFLFVSGYFIAFATGRRRDSLDWKIVQERILGLLIPYLVWSTLLLLIAHLFLGQRGEPREILISLLTGRTNESLYYIPLLVQFYLLAPVIVLLAKRNWKALILLALLLQLTVQLLYYPVILGLQVPAQLRPMIDAVPKWVFLTRIFWFSAGVVAGFQVDRLGEFLARHRRKILIGTLLLIPVGFVEWELYLQASGQAWIGHRETFIDNLYAAGVILSVLAYDFLPTAYARMTDDLGARSFGIYLVHYPVMEYLARGVYHLVPGLLAVQILYQPLLILVGLGIPLLAMQAVNRSPVRRYYGYLFG